LFLRKTANYWVPVLIILAMIGLTFLNLHLDEQTNLEDHFAPRWSAAKNWMAEGWSPYSEETTQSTLDLLELTNSKPELRSQGRFTDPAWYVILFLPISFIPYTIAKAIWIMFLQVSVGISIFLAIELSELRLNSLGVFLTVTLGMLFYPFILDYLTASMLPVFIMFTLLAIKLALTRQGNHAGFLMLLALWMNPAGLLVTILLLIILSGRRDQSMLQIILIGFVFLLVTSLILFPGWIPDWFANIIKLEPKFDWLNTPWMGLAAVFPGASRQLAIILHLATFIVLLVEWYGMGEQNDRSLQWKLMLTLSVSYFFNLFSDGSALLFIFPGFFLVFKYFSEKWKVSGKILYWVAFIITGFLSWHLTDDPLSSFPKTDSVLLILVPLLAFLGLQWFRWWAISSPKALIESE